MSKKKNVVINKNQKNKFKYKGEDDMYETKEFYGEDKYDLKEILRSCLLNFYYENKDRYLNNYSNDLTK